MSPEVQARFWRGMSLTPDPRGFRRRSGFSAGILALRGAYDIPQSPRWFEWFRKPRPLVMDMVRLERDILMELEEV